MRSPSSSPPTSPTSCSSLAGDPRPLADALSRHTARATLIHGDLRGDNLGFDGDRLVLIDWDLATAGTPGVEFAWYLAHSARRIDASHDEIEADHRSAQGDELSRAEHELGMFSGLVQYGWRIAHSARIHPDPAETAWGRAELDGGCPAFVSPSSERAAGSRLDCASGVHAVRHLEILHVSGGTPRMHQLWPSPRSRDRSQGRAFDK